MPLSDGNVIRARDVFRAKSFRRANERDSMKEKIRYAVVGLGHIARRALLPAFGHAENSELAALVTGNPEKDRELTQRYEVKAYTYEDLEKALDEQEVDARLHFYA